MKTLIILIITLIAPLFAISFSSNSFGDNLSMRDNCLCCNSKCIEARCCEDNCCGSVQGIKSGCAADCPVDICKECCKAGRCEMKIDSESQHKNRHSDHNTSDDLLKSCCITKAANHNNGNCCK